MRVSKDYTFNEAHVEEWCEQSGDSNILHLDEQKAAETEFFDGRIVPGMMLLDRVSGLITEWSQTKDGTPILSRLSGVSFDAPVYLGETVEISIEEAEIDGETHILRFEVVNADAPADPKTEGFVTVYMME